MSIRTRRNSKRLLAGVLAGAFALSGVAISTNVSAADDVSAANVTPASDRISGADRYSTSVAVAETIGTSDIDTIILATGNNFPDGLAAASLAGLSAATTAVLLTEPGALPGVVVDYLESPNLDIDTLYVLGGTVAISDAVVDEAVEALGWTAAEAASGVVRITGANRFATAANIATTVNTAVRTAPGATSGVVCVVLATGENFPDALSAGSLAVDGPCPILLNSGSTLRAETAAALAALTDVVDVFIVGGTAVVPTAIQTALSNDGYSVLRLSGANRYGTAVAVANLLGTTYGDINVCAPGAAPAVLATVAACAAVGSPATLTTYSDVPVAYTQAEAMLLVSGTNFPDALSASPLTVAGPILLTAPTALPPATASWVSANQNSLNEVAVIGGTAAVSADVLTATVTAGTTPTPTLTSTLGLRTSVAQAAYELEAGEVTLSATAKGPIAGAAGNTVEVVIVSQTGATPTIASTKPSPGITRYTIGVPVPAADMGAVTIAQLRAAFQSSSALRAVFTLAVGTGADLTLDVENTAATAYALADGGVNALVAGVANVVCDGTDVTGTFGGVDNPLGFCGDNTQQTWSLWNNPALSGAIWGALFEAGNGTVPRLAQLNGVAGLLPPSGLVVWPFAPAAAEYPTVQIAPGDLVAGSTPAISNALRITSSITWIDAPL